MRKFFAASPATSLELFYARRGSGLERKAMPQNPMVPRLLTCEQCAQTSVVKAYLPIYEDGWEAPPAEEPVLNAMTCIIDC